MNTADHWNDRHRSTPVEELSWYQTTATTSLAMLDAVGVEPVDSVIDVGGGVSPLALDLVERGFRDVTVLDVSSVALSIAARRLPNLTDVCWLPADVRTWQPERTWRVWHDRAVFHFCVTDDDRVAYLTTMSRALEPGGALVIATFAPDGPHHCSGLPACRYDTSTLLSAIATYVDVELIGDQHHVHTTPSGARQAFTWLACRRQP